MLFVTSVFQFGFSYGLTNIKCPAIANAETNNGVMICIFPRLRGIWIQTGSGIEKIMTDEETKNIIEDKIVPEFKKGDFLKEQKEA